MQQCRAVILQMFSMSVSQYKWMLCSPVLMHITAPIHLFISCKISMSQTKTNVPFNNSHGHLYSPRVPPAFLSPVRPSPSSSVVTHLLVVLACHHTCKNACVLIISNAKQKSWWYGNTKTPPSRPTDLHFASAVLGRS